MPSFRVVQKYHTTLKRYSLAYRCGGVTALYGYVRFIWVYLCILCPEIEVTFVYSYLIKAFLVIQYSAVYTQRSFTFF